MTDEISRRMVRDANAERDAAEARARDLTADYERLCQVADEYKDRTRKWRLRAESAERERDLAVAHDRQPYPTAWAYEQACRALEKHRSRADAAVARAERLEARLETVKSGRDGLEGRYTALCDALGIEWRWRWWPDVLSDVRAAVARADDLQAENERLKAQLAGDSR